MTPEEWLESIFKTYVQKHSPPLSESEHLKEFITKNPQTKLSTRVSYQDLLRKANQWTKNLNQKKLSSEGETSLVSISTKGLRLVHLLDQAAKDWEGKYMHHCVSSYQNHRGIYSVRTEDNRPVATLEVVFNLVVQIRGRFNQPTPSDLRLEILELIRSQGWEVTPSELQNLGYLKLSPWDKKFVLAHYEGAEVVEINNNFFTHSPENWKQIRSLKYFYGGLFTFFIKKKVSLNLLTPFISLERFDYATWINTIINYGDLDLLKEVVEKFDPRLEELVAMAYSEDNGELVLETFIPANWRYIFSKVSPSRFNKTLIVDCFFEACLLPDLTLVLPFFPFTQRGVPDACIAKALREAYPRGREDLITLIMSQLPSNYYFSLEEIEDQVAVSQDVEKFKRLLARGWVVARETVEEFKDLNPELHALALENYESNFNGKE